jgi:hypothetical protein
MDLPAERLREIGRWLAEYGTRRHAVALGILLLGLAGDQRDRDLLLLLGSLEDRTLYAAVALTRSQPDRDQALFDLAQRVSGWGRIHAIRRLAVTQDPQIKGSLLRHGFRNQILDEYLAHLAATTGDLYSALITPPVDDELILRTTPDRAWSTPSRSGCTPHVIVAPALAGTRQIEYAVNSEHQPKVHARHSAEIRVPAAAAVVSTSGAPPALRLTWISTCVLAREMAR